MGGLGKEWLSNLGVALLRRSEKGYVIDFGVELMGGLVVEWASNLGLGLLGSLGAGEVHNSGEALVSGYEELMVGLGM